MPPHHVSTTNRRNKIAITTDVGNIKHTDYIVHLIVDEALHRLH